MARHSRPRPGTDDFKSAHWPYTMPSPEAREGGHSLWELWQEAARGLEQAFAPTQPWQAAAGGVGTATPSAEALPSPAPAAPALHPLKAEVLMVAARHNNRVCPRPAPWALLYETLGGTRCPELRPPPVQEWQWAMVPPLQKRLHFREHIEWAARNRRLKPLALFMKGLDESDWLHMGES